MEEARAPWAPLIKGVLAWGCKRNLSLAKGKSTSYHCIVDRVVNASFCCCYLVVPLFSLIPDPGKHVEITVEGRKFRGNTT